MEAWLARHREAIEVFFLPSYSRDLNLDELANADLKHALDYAPPRR